MKSLFENNNSSPSKYSRWPLVGLFIFTSLSAIGYATFGRHPEWLQFIPDPFISKLSLFFGMAFTFFAQGHIWISCGVLILYLSRRVGSRWISGFLAVYFLSLSSELAGTRFGFPFGEYEYTSLLGLKWFGLVPLLIPISWFTMALPSFVLSYYTFPGSNQFLKRIAFAALLLTVWDLSLDPAMSYLTTYWTWGDTGPYYGMPWINLAGWYFTGLVLMTVLHALKTERWARKLSLRWVSTYYGLVLLLPLLMILAAGLWGALLTTLAAVLLCAWLIDRNQKKHNNNDDFSSFGTLNRIVRGTIQNPDDLGVDGLKDYFSSHSRSFSFAARFFSTEQYQLVTRLYAFCRTTDDIADTMAIRRGGDSAEAELNKWEERVYLSYQGIPSGIEWLDELMNRSNQSGLPFDLIQDLIAGVRTDLRSVEINTTEELDRYCYCVASVVGIWLCYLFGVRDPDLLGRASAMGRAMQITNILRDVGEDLRMDRVYLPTELMEGYDVTREDLMAMEAGALPISEAYQSLMEDLMERAEADYRYAFRGLSAIPPSFARAAAVASEVYRGIHRSLRRNRYNNFKRRAYTRWYEKIWLALRALRRLKQVQNRPFITTSEPVFFSNHQLSNNHKRQKPLIVTLITVLLCAQGMLLPHNTLAQLSTMSFKVSVMTENISFTAHPRPAKADGDRSFQNLDASDPSINKIRAFYVAGVEDESALEDGLAHIDRLSQTSPLILAYEAAMIVLKAKHAFWPQKKMRFLNEGLPELDSLVASNPEDVEIRYLRLLSRYYLPKFLGMSSSVEEDSKTLARLLPESEHLFPRDVYDSMVEFVATIHHLSDEEKEPLIVHMNRPSSSSFSHSNQVFKTYE